jgi:acetyl esterase/lipase
MDILIKIIQLFAAFTGCLAVLSSLLLFRRLHWPAPALWFLKLYTSALSPIIVLTGIVVAMTGLLTGSLFISITGSYVILIFCIHIFNVTRPPVYSNGFENAFGENWKQKINNEKKEHFLKSRTSLKLPSVPAPFLEQNISFATIPGTERNILCDIWQPPANISHSGLAFIYLHGGAWYFLDKDLGTRPFFKHLTAQGHVIMDVAYRMAPETGIMGMVHDVQRAIVWMKENGGFYKVDPDKIIIGGGSSGGHLALLTAYTFNDPVFTARELIEKDRSVRAVVSIYGPADLEAMYFHTNQHLTTRERPGKAKKSVPTKMPQWIIKKMGKEYHRLGMDKGFVNAGAIAPLLGGHPDECPETYAMFSPISHVHRGCPPTLLIHGEHDLMAPVKTTRALNTKLQDNKVQTVMHIIPQSDHAFDLILPGISQSAHNVIYDVERFLALVINETPVVRTGNYKIFETGRMTPANQNA